jgi:hypothetical protein
MATPQQIAHYTNLAAQAAAMQSAQRDYDNRAEVEDDQPEVPDDADGEGNSDPAVASADAMAMAGRADRALIKSDYAAAGDLYRNAAQLLLTAAEMAEALL